MKDQRDLMNYCHDLDLQDNPVLPAPIKEIQVEHLYGEVYKAYMILDNGTKIWCNTGVVGDHIGYTKYKKQEPAEWFKEELEKHWFKRNRRWAVLVK